LNSFSQVVHRCPRRSRREGAEASFASANRQGKLPELDQLYFRFFARFHLPQPQM
jgi:hypothetical protein